MKKLLIISLLLSFYLINTSIKSSAQNKWIKENIGNLTWVNKLAIADGRNDGVNRLYGATHNGVVAEWTYNNVTNEWDKAICCTVGSGINADYDPFFYALKAGYGRNDGKVRLYGVTMNGLSYEFYYNSETQNWEITLLDNGKRYKPQNMLVGDARNDGVNRVIGAGINVFGVPYYSLEYTWNQNENNYDNKLIVDGPRDLYQGDLGDARNDGLNSIYMPDRYGYMVREYSWEENSYIENTIPVEFEIHRLIIGDPQNSGTNHIYISEGFTHQQGLPKTGSIKELTYENSSWIQNVIHSNVFTGYGRHEMDIGSVRDNDTKKRLYSVARDGALVEHSYENSEWETERIDAVSGATATLQIGDARNDHVNRIYITGECGKILEYTHSSVIGISNIENKIETVKNYPNPCSLSTTFQYSLLSKSNVKLSIYSSNGELVFYNSFPNQSKGEQNVSINCSELCKGTYFYKLEVNGIYIGSNKLIIAE